jgi:hypothetical protein
MDWAKLIQGLDSTMSTMYLFLSSNANKFIIHTLLHLERIIQELIGYSIVKTKHNGRVEVF